MYAQRPYEYLAQTEAIFLHDRSRYPQRGAAMGRPRSSLDPDGSPSSAGICVLLEEILRLALAAVLYERIA